MKKPHLKKALSEVFLSVLKVNQYQDTPLIYQQIILCTSYMIAYERRRE